MKETFVMEIVDREVRFDIWCSSCKHEKAPECEDPCYECLNYPVNQESEKPVRWEDKNS